MGKCTSRALFSYGGLSLDPLSESVVLRDRERARTSILECNPLQTQLLHNNFDLDINDLSHENDA